MNTTRINVGLATTVPLAVLLLVAFTFPLLGAANAQTQPRPEPGVSAAAAVAGAPGADAAIAAAAAGVAHHAPGGVLRDTHGYAYLGKQKAILEHLDRPRRFQTAPTVSPPAPAAHSRGVPRDTHGRAYLGKQHANLEHS
jgi:hypothetical protein